MAEVVLCIDFMKCNLLEATLAVSEQLEQTVTNDAQLSVVQRIKRYLEEPDNLHFLTYRNPFTPQLFQTFKTAT